MPEHLLLFFIPLEIPEGDLPVLTDGGVQHIHIVIDLLVRCLDAPGDDHLALQLLCLMGADQPLQLFNEVLGFPVGDELRGLHRIHQELQLGELKPAASQVIISVPADLLTDDLEAEVRQLLKILVKSLSVRIDLAGGEFLDDLRHGEPVRVVGGLGEDLHQVKHLQFLIIAFGHSLFVLPIKFCY